MKTILLRALGVAALALVSATSLSCDVNEYCIGCAVNGDGGNGDSTDGGDGDAVDAPDGDAPDASDCIPAGAEVCNDKDDDCDGNTDEGSLPTIGEACSSAPAINSGQGECAGGVKQCSANGTIVCSKPPSPELCDLKDNNCNGLTDEGDPGGGALCGTNTGECTAGVNRCVNGAIDCVGDIGSVGGQTEVCNNRDDDCDGMFDENVVTGGACTTGTDTGLCDRGTLMCLGGISTCVGQIGPTFELCDGFDQDCDGNNTNGYNLMTDVQNCGSCGMSCNLPNSFEGCAGGLCAIVACEPNFFNNNNVTSDGCEFNCGHPFLGAEVCNGIDDDCDGLTDIADPDMTAPTGLCDFDGACSTGTTLFCGPPPGMPAGTITWRCDYSNPNVQKDASGNLIPETRCDSDIVAGVQADNDCDGRIDESQEPNLGNSCTNGMQGLCQSTGTFICNAANRDLAATCNAPAGGTATAETCDGIDNNCDGIVDNGANLGTLAGQEWVNIPGSTVDIMKYEASRPDALTTNSLQTHACSTAGRAPWTNVTYPQAVAACSSISARLCTEAEWQSMCTPPSIYPVAGPATTGVTDFSFIEAEDAIANTQIGPASQAWVRQAPLSFNGITAMQVANNGFQVIDPTTALATASRLDYQLNLAAATGYRVWTRMRHTTSTIYGVQTAPSSTLAPTSHTSTGVGDLVIVMSFTRSTSGVPTHTLQAGFTLLTSQALDDGNDDARLSVAYRVATAAGAQTNQAFVASGGTGLTSFSGITVINAGHYDLANTSATSAVNATNNVGPDPSSITVTVPSAVIALGAWRMSASDTVSVFNPSDLTLQSQVSGSNSADLATARPFTIVAPADTTFDPAAFPYFAPSATLTGTVGVTIAIGLRSDIWMGINAGATAGAPRPGGAKLSTPNQWQWVAGPLLTTGAAGTYTLSLFTGQDGVYVDTIAISRQVTNAPTFDNSWAYQNNPRTEQPGVCNDESFDTDAVTPGDQDGILPAGQFPACFANQTAADDAYDMSGNVKEWTLARVAGQNPLRGGSSNNETSGQTCGLNFTLADDQFFFPNAGFRCCR
ncbi:MAG: hypothetical protein H0T42_22800 [Deltaproteobacteria bacterium]|nr:hypothetical protein [Deltaproteobacteria bacterium]